jgi:hypothetical protein
MSERERKIAAIKREIERLDGMVEWAKDASWQQHKASAEWELAELQREQSGTESTHLPSLTVAIDASRAAEKGPSNER